MEAIFKSFGGISALEDVDFEVGEAEVVALVGDNGAGKSTLIKILAGVHAHDGGRIFMNGKEIEINTPARAKQHGIETVFQELALAENLDAPSNLFLGREITRFSLFGSNLLSFLDKPRMEGQAREVLDDFGLSVGSLRTKISTYSGGERQAVAIARALYSSPKLIILDEPTAALAVEESRKVLELIGRLRDQGISVVFITHVLEEALQVADRIVVMRSGRIAGSKQPSETDKENLVSLMIG